MSGAEVVHTFVATMPPVGAIASWSDASSVWQGRRLPRCRICRAPGRLDSSAGDHATMAYARLAKSRSIRHTVASGDASTSGDADLLGGA